MGKFGKLLFGAFAVVGIAATALVVGVTVKQKTCEHEWDAGKVVAEATCTHVGKIEYECEECGKTKTEEVPALEHNYVDGVCTECGGTEATEGETDSESSTESGEETSTDSEEQTESEEATESGETVE